MSTTTPLNPWPYVMGSWPDPEQEAEVDAWDRLGYEPNCVVRIAAKDRGEVVPPCGRCPQERFHAATEDRVLYGGAAGGGKSLALLMEGLRACMRHPGIWVGAFRRTYDELAESFLKALARYAYGEDLGASWNKTEKELTFPVRAGRVSKMRFRYVQSEADASRRQGGDYQLLLVDEATLLAPGVLARLEERLRSADPAVPVLGTRISSNPGGPSHVEVKSTFITPTDHGAHPTLDESGRSVAFVPARLADNPYLDRDEGYHRILDGIPDPARRAAMKDGNWDVFSGQFFEQWNRDRHVVDPMPIPPEWAREEGIDYGYAKPWAVAFGAYDNDGRVWIYRELYGTKVGQTEQAQRILAAEGDERIEARHADPSMWAKTGEHNSNAEIYAQEGCQLRRAVNDRVIGWARVHHYLAEMPACDLHRARGWETCPRLHVFSSCVNWIRTVPDLPRDPAKPEDVDTDAEDHLGDATRYLLMGRGREVEAAAPQEMPGTNDWDLGPSAADFTYEDLGGYADYGR